MSPLTRILLVVAIILVALIGLGFGLCGVAGLALGLRSNANVGANLFVLACGISGIGVAVGAVILIRTTLWKALWRKDRD